MSFLLNKKNEHETACEEAIRAGKSREAIFHAAKAAEFAYALAEQAGGSLQPRYIEEAEGWLEIAEKIKQAPLKGGAAGDGKGAKASAQKAEEGDVAADSWLITVKPKVSFDDIAGMLDAKESIHDMVILPLKDPEKARALKLKPGGGVLLYGPPGTGKTLLGKAVAHELDAAFFYASGAQLRSKWHGESEQRLRALLQAAKSQPVAVLFLDEVDGLLPKRGGNSVVDNRIVAQFLAEVGGFEESDNVLLILGATNNPWDIDEAVFRTGRFDEKIHVGLPDDPARQGILRMHLESLPLQEGFDFAKWADRLTGYTGSDIVGIVNDAKRAALRRSVTGNTDPQVTEADLEQAFKTIPSSVTPAMLRRYQEFGKQRFG